MGFSMKYFILMSSFLLFSFATQAQFARQEQRPEYFIPEREIVKAPSVVVEPQRSKNSSEAITHISANTGKPQKSENPSKTTAHISPQTDKSQTASNMKVPHFQKKYDEYHKDILTLQKTRRLPANQKLKDDLSKMSGNERFEVGD